MALKIYESANPAASFSTDSSFDNAITHSIDGLVGGTIEKKYYVRNSDSGKYYTSITLLPFLSSGIDIIGGTNNFSWKIYAGSIQPTAQEWATISDGNTISLDDLGSSGSPNTSSYLPFWLRIQVPKNVPIQSFETVKLRIVATEHNV